jgi:peptidyl-prolyl cis-trans isomerase C
MRFFSRLVREPFLHFLLLGAVIFAGTHLRHADADRYRILVGPEQVARLIDTYRKQYGRAPEREQLQALIDQDIREEILYREGVALKLEDQDQIVRRRVAQKFEFLQLDRGTDLSANDADVENFYHQHLADYLSPAKVSFTHVYISSSDPVAPTNPLDPTKRVSPLVRAARLRDRLQSTGAVRAPAAGDRFAGSYDYSSLDKVSLSRVFGDSPIVDALMKAPEHGWVGPVQSAYGWHVIYVATREPQRQPPLSEIRERVLADYREQARKAESAAAFARLRSKYVIVRDKDVIVRDGASSG